MCRREIPHGINALLVTKIAAEERSNLIQIIPAEGTTMNNIGYLQDQAAKAERLANGALDKLTIERLLGFAADCRQQIQTQQMQVPQIQVRNEDQAIDA